MIIRIISNNNTRIRKYFHENEDVNDYIAQVENDKDWIDDARIVHAMADVLQINIHIHNNQGVDVTISPTNGEAAQTIELFYTGNHYMSVVSKNFNPLEPLRLSSDPYDLFDQDDMLNYELSEMDSAPDSSNGLGMAGVLGLMALMHSTSSFHH